MVSTELANKRFNRNLSNLESVINKRVPKQNKMYEDIHQELLLELWYACLNYDGSGYFQTYIYNTLINKLNLILNKYSKKEPRLIIKSIYDIDNSIINNILVNMIYNESLNKLSDKSREIVNKYFLNNFTYLDIEKSMDTSKEYAHYVCKRFLERCRNAAIKYKIIL